MGDLVLFMSMSLDGYVAGPDDRPGQEMGAGGFRLFDWLDDRHGEGVNGQVYAEALATGAVLAGRRTFELAGRWNGDHHDGVPIHVLTHRSDPDDVPAAGTTFHTDVHEAAAAARASGGDREVLVHGAGAAQSLLAAGELDQIQIHLVQVLLGGGRRLFADGADRVELEPVRRLDGRDVTHLRYRVVKPGEQYQDANRPDHGLA
jgi:dihydrofolate reductase